MAVRIKPHLLSVSLPLIDLATITTAPCDRLWTITHISHLDRTTPERQWPLGVRHQAIAYAQFVDDKRGARRVGLQLLAEVAHHDT